MGEIFWTYFKIFVYYTVVFLLIHFDYFAAQHM